MLHGSRDGMIRAEVDNCFFHFLMKPNDKFSPIVATLVFTKQNAFPQAPFGRISTAKALYSRMSYFYSAN